MWLLLKIEKDPGTQRGIINGVYQLLLTRPPAAEGSSRIDRPVKRSISATTYCRVSLYKRAMDRFVASSLRGQKVYTLLESVMLQSLIGSIGQGRESPLVMRFRYSLSLINLVPVRNDVSCWVTVEGSSDPGVQSIWKE